MKFIGLLMICDEDDILADTLDANGRMVDCFYVLDGTADTTVSERVCTGHPKCWGYTRDRQLPKPPYSDRPVDGYRQHLYEEACVDHGPDNWFLLLHGDEMWTRHPRHYVSDRHDGYWFLLPFWFPRAGEPWDDSRGPLEQLRWHLGPGYPEFRLFRGGNHVRYSVDQHFNVEPAGLTSPCSVPHPIRHYPYRSPAVQRRRAALHAASGFDPDNYRHILDGDRVYWTDEMIDGYRQQEWFANLEEGVTVGAFASRV